MPTKKLPTNKNLIFPFPKRFHSQVLAFTIDSHADFKYRGTKIALTKSQKAFLKRLGAFDPNQLVNIKQVHGRRIGIISRKNIAKKTYRQTDGLLTDQAGIPLAIRTADCMPVFLYDTKRHIAGIVHAGWKGTKKRITQKAVKIMKKRFGSHANDIIAGLGPCIRVCCYKVGRRSLRDFPNEIKMKKGKPFLDLALANKRQLLKEGIRPKHIFDTKFCTHCQKCFFSFRRDAEKAGRMLSVILM